MLGKQNIFGKRDDTANSRESRLGSYAHAAAVGAPGATGAASTAINPTLPAAQAPINPSAPAATAAPAAAKHDDTSSRETASENRLIVGPDVKLKGAEILDCDTLIVEGRVEATMDSRVINIAENGSFSGKVGIDVAEINGSFEGELVARSQLIIHATGRVSGKIRYGKILIEAGGEISGDVRSLASDADNIPVLTARATLVPPVDLNKPKSLATLS